MFSPNFNKHILTFFNDSNTYFKIFIRIMELNKIYLGDALDLIKKIPTESIDLILTDPPYGLNKDYD